jgi:heme exporter protein D
MPDLGKYGDTVLSAYGVSIALLVVLIGLSLWRGRKVRIALSEVEERAKRNG